MLASIVCLSLSLTADPTSWSVTTASGQSIARGPVTLSSSWGVSIGETTILGADLISLRRSDVALPGWPREGQVILANGDRLPGHIDSADDKALIWTNATLSKVRIPLTTITSIWTALPAGTPADPMQSEWLGVRKVDTLRLANGDTITGGLERIAKDGKSISFRNGESRKTDIPIAKVVGVSFSNGLSRVRSPKGVFGHVVLRDGSRFTVTNIRQTADQTTFETAAGFTAVVPISEIVTFNVINGRADSLADLKPKRNESKPFGLTTWPMQVNRSANMNPLRLESALGIETYDRGLGTHAKTNLEFNLGKKYRRFQTILGLDAVTGQKGNATITIAVDDQVTTFSLTADTGSVPIQRDVTNAKVLTLKIEWGSAGDRQTDVNWAEAILVK